MNINKFDTFIKLVFENYLTTFEEGRIWSAPRINTMGKYGERHAAGVEAEDSISKAINELPNFNYRVIKGTSTEDKNEGIDYWMIHKTRKDSKPISVQLKYRQPRNSTDREVNQLAMEMIKPWLRTADKYNQSKLTGKDWKFPQLYFHVTSNGVFRVLDGNAVRNGAKLLTEFFIRTHGREDRMSTEAGDVAILKYSENHATQRDSMEKLMVFLNITNPKFLKSYLFAGPYQLLNIDTP